MKELEGGDDERSSGFGRGGVVLVEERVVHRIFNLALYFRPRLDLCDRLNCGAQHLKTDVFISGVGGGEQGGDRGWGEVL